MSSTEVTVNQAMPLLKSWLLSHMPQVHAIHHANLKPGSLQTPDVLRSGPIRLTVWLQPTSATYVVGHNNTSQDDDDDETSDFKFSLFQPCAQTLVVTAERDD